MLLALDLVACLFGFLSILPRLCVALDAFVPVYMLASLAWVCILADMTSFDILQSLSSQ